MCISRNSCFISHAGTKGRPKQQEKEKTEVTRELRDDDSRNRDTPNNKPPRKRLRVNRNKRYPMLTCNG